MKARCLAAALIALCVSSVATPEAELSRVSAWKDTDPRIGRIASRVTDPVLLEALSRDSRQLTSPLATAAVKRDMKERATARLYLYRLAHGGVSADALAASGIQASDLLAASRADGPEISTVLPRAREFFPQELVLSRLTRPSPLTIDPDMPAPQGADPQLASPGPPAYDPSTGRFQRLVYREGFSQVILLGRTRKLGERTESVCTGTLFESGWVLTAAHCMFDAAGRIPAGQLAFFLPFQSGSYAVHTPQAVNERMLRVGFDDADVSLLDPQFRPGFLVSAQDVLGDLALVRLSSLPAKVKVRPTVIRFGTTNRPFTFAGYGLTNAADAGKDGLTLEVARRNAQVEVASSHIVFRTAALSTALGRVCLGDSGAPVFAGELNGSDPPKTFEMVGVVNGSVESGGYVDACKSGQQFVVRVNTPRVRDWMCNVTAKVLCPV